MIKTLRIVLLMAVVCAGLSLATSTSDAQVGYYEGYYPSYRPYSYRSMARTGKYHGYWRDQGYGFSTRGYYLPQVNYYGGYAPAPYVDPHYYPPNYYPPQPRPYGYR